MRPETPALPSQCPMLDFEDVMVPATYLIVLRSMLRDVSVLKSGFGVENGGWMWLRGRSGGDSGVALSWSRHSRRRKLGGAGRGR